MSQRRISCIVFMPFDAAFSFVYDLGVTPALDLLIEQGQLNSYWRADKELVLDGDKTDEVIKQLVHSDLVLADITHHKPNVLWELGFAHALKKPVVILSQRGVELPFNINNRDVVTYEFSKPGVEKLAHELESKLSPILGRMVVPLRNDEDIHELYQSITHSLSLLERESILKNFVRNEMERLDREIKGLRRGEFELRNEKPNAEIIRYFSDYVVQLSSGGSQYDTVSTENFWKAITDDGKDFKYLRANLDAARAGARIRRIFLLDGGLYTHQSVREDPLFRRILAEHYTMTEDGRGNVETRVYFSPKYLSDLERYMNFAIWRKGAEVMLFVPGYNDGKMTETAFRYYHDKKLFANERFPQNKQEIERYRERFSDLWNKGRKLEHAHFD